jgi:cell division septal protein FtsQ
MVRQPVARWQDRVELYPLDDAGGRDLDDLQRADLPERGTTV